jgi:hypothetical protein
MQIALDDGSLLRLNLRDSRRRWNRAFQAALRRGTLLEIEDSNGEVLGINPRDVRCIRFAPESPVKRPRSSGASAETPTRNLNGPRRRPARAKRLDLARDREAATEAIPFDFRSDY